MSSLLTPTPAAAASAPEQAAAGTPDPTHLERLERLTDTRGHARLDILRARFKTALALISSEAAEAERSASLQAEGVRALIDSGFTRLRVPTEFGGLDVTLVELFSLVADLGAADPGVANALRGHIAFIELLRRSETGTPGREEWLRRIAAGKVIGNSQTDAPGAAPASWRRDDAGTRRLTARKAYSSGTLYADYVRSIVFEEDDRPVIVLLDATGPGVTRHADWNGFGQRTSASGTVEFEDAAILEDGFLPGLLEQAPHESFVQLYHLATLVGIARAALETAIRSSQQSPPRREVFGDYELDAVGELYLATATAESLTASNARALERSFQQFERGEADAFRIANIYTLTAQVRVIEEVLGATTKLFNVAGARLTSVAADLDRHWRNARTIASHNPTIVKPRLIGDYLVHGKTPASIFAAFPEHAADSVG